MSGSTRIRSPDEETRERDRYAFLERLYLLTGPHCEQRVYLWELEAELGPSTAIDPEVVRDLVQLGYVRQTSADSSICITEKGIAYLQEGAWRRRSIRD